MWDHLVRPVVVAIPPIEPPTPGVVRAGHLGSDHRRAASAPGPTTASVTIIDIITARPARPDELDEVRDLLRVAYAGYAAMWPEQVWDTYLADLLDVDGATTLVASLDGRIVGTIRLYHPATARVPVPPTWAYMRAAAVLPAARGRGIARQLMAACAHRAQHAGAAALGLHTASFMTGTLRLCELFGYRRVPEWDIDGRAHYGLADGGSLVALTYVLDLDPENRR